MQKAQQAPCIQKQQPNVTTFKYSTSRLDWPSIRSTKHKARRQKQKLNAMAVFSGTYHEAKCNRMRLWRLHATTSCSGETPEARCSSQMPWLHAAEHTTTKCATAKGNHQLQWLKAAKHTTTPDARTVCRGTTYYTSNSYMQWLYAAEHTTRPNAVVCGSGGCGCCCGVSVAGCCSDSGGSDCTLRALLPLT